MSLFTKAFNDKSARWGAAALEGSVGAVGLAVGFSLVSSGDVVTGWAVTAGAGFTLGDTANDIVGLLKPKEL